MEFWGGQFGDMYQVLKLFRLVALAFPFLKEIMCQMWKDVSEYSLSNVGKYLNVNHWKPDQIMEHHKIK